MNSFDSAFEKVCKLVEDFKANEKRYLSAEYQEAEVRRDFIDKFFEAIGWDVYHNVQKNPYEQEVKVEKGVSVGKAQKRADYAFYINPEFRDPKFFTEAKKPCRKLKNADDYFQTVRYGWNANTPVAVLTDFEEFHILDCRYKPDIDAVLQNQNNKIFNYTDYANPEKFKEIYFLFSRNAVADGSLTKYSDALPKPKGKVTQWGLFKGIVKPIDEDFLEYIDDVRETLARAFKKNDPSLTSEQLTEVTQKTVDRLVFIRFLEDKLIEPEYYISELGTKGNIWKEFISLCKKLDAKYNGIVFKGTTIDKQDFQGPELIEFRKICEDISHLNSPYDFHYIPIHILGSIYERFLGKIVTLKGRGIKIEEKPEVRKAGGVYYTPKYIVDYIIKNSIGKLIENKTPEEISKLRFADIACGSGSFLIGVYDYLLEYHKTYYQKNITKAEKDGCVNVNGLMTLSLSQKQNILLNNIYGVDIDQQAVEVTQLSLALKMLEDETTFSARQMNLEFRKKIIPEGLGNNIICGNSLISTDILFNISPLGFEEKTNILSKEEELKTNPMDFKTSFANIFKNGKFDAIIGNPPYGAELSNIEKKYLKKKYKSDNLNTAALFVLQSKLLINDSGVIGLIIPKSFNYSSKWLELRRNISSDLSIILDASKAFKDVLLEQVVIILYRTQKQTMRIGNISKETTFLNDIKKSNFKRFDVIPFANKDDFKIANKILRNSITFADNIKAYRGIDVPQNKLSNDYDIPIYSCKNIQRYSIINSNRGISYDYYHKNEDSLSFMNKEKIVIQNIVAHIQNPFPHILLMATWDNKNIISLGSVSNIFIKEGINISEKFVIGLINSRLINWYAYKFIYCDAIRTMRLDNYHFERMPFPKLNLKVTTDKQKHDKLISMVDQITEIKALLQTESTERKRTYYSRRFSELDMSINFEVYNLYKLTEEEIKIVEGRT